MGWNTVLFSVQEPRRRGQFWSAGGRFTCLQAEQVRFSARAKPCMLPVLHGFKLRPLTFQYEFVALFSKLSLPDIFKGDPDDITKMSKMQC